MYTTGKAQEYITRSKSTSNEKYHNGLYAEPSMAAYAFGAKYNSLSIANDREYGAVILEVNIDGQRLYTWKRTYRGTKTSVLKMFLAAVSRIGVEKLLRPKKVKYCANVHTHSSCMNKQGVFTSNGLFFFSPNDMKFLPKNKYLITPDGALHYAEGTPSRFISTHPTNKRKQEYYESNGWWYGQIIGRNLPHDTACGAFCRDDSHSI